MAEAAGVKDTLKGRFDIKEMILMLFAAIFGSAFFQPLFASFGLSYSDMIWNGVMLGVIVWLSYKLLMYAVERKITVKGVELLKFIIAGLIVSLFLGNLVGSALAAVSFLSVLATGIAFYIALWIVGLVQRAAG